MAMANVAPPSSKFRAAGVVGAICVAVTALVNGLDIEFTMTAEMWSAKTAVLMLAATWLKPENRSTV